MFVTKAAKAAGNDPRNFTVKSLPGVSFSISLDNDGACKGFQVGGGKFATVKVPGNMIAPTFLHPDVIAAAKAASDAVDVAVKAGKFTPVDKGQFVAWDYKG